MKIGFAGINLPEGKVKYNDEQLNRLAEKDKPKKISPFFAELVKEVFDACDAIVITRERILDLLILDMEKIETRAQRLEGENEKLLLQRCLKELEQETPLCDIPLSAEEKKIVESAAVYSLKPVVKIQGAEDVNTIISLAIDKAGYMFFYTSGPTESHAWIVKKGSDIVTCAGRIHTDLARGFIKGDVVSFDDYLQCHNFNECKSKGLAKLVDRDYIVQPGEIIEIRFNV